jgi:hypothetical protein
MVITGDLQQTDILKENGLGDFIGKINCYNIYNKNSNLINIVELTNEDIERSEIVKNVINIYNYVPTSISSTVKRKYTKSIKPKIVEYTDNINTNINNNINSNSNNTSILKTNDTDLQKINKTLKKSNKNVFYQPDNKKILKYLRQNLQSGDVLAFLGSRDFGGVMEKIID